MSGDLPLSRAGLSQESFRRLLGSLDPDPDRAGEAYERLRRKLIKFFEWRGTRCPEDLADRTIDRVGRKIEEGERIRLEDPTGYFYAVARNVLREHWGDEKHHVASLKLINSDPTTRTPEDVSRAAEEAAETETRLDCLEQCLERLPAESRELITQYYRGQRSVKIENRKALAEGLGIPINALRIRSHRVRVTLETCVRECLRVRRDAKWIRSSATEEKESRNDH